MTINPIAREEARPRRRRSYCSLVVPYAKGKPAISKILGAETISALAVHDPYPSRATFLHDFREKLSQAEVQHVLNLRYEADPGDTHWADEVRRYRAINRRIMADLYHKAVDGIMHRAVNMNKLDLSTQNLERVRTYIKEEAPKVKLKGYITISEYTEALINEVLELRREKERREGP